MPREIDLLSILPINLIVAAFIILFLAGSVIFSFLVIKQVSVMCSVVESGVNVILKLIARLLFLASVGLLVIAIVLTFFN